MANSPAEVKTRGWNTVAGSDPEPRKGVLAPKNGDMGSLPATVWISPRPNCSWF